MEAQSVCIGVKASLIFNELWTTCDDVVAVVYVSFSGY